MAKLSLVCWKCGAGLDEVPQPLSKYSECLACRAELHVCRMCRFYDTRVAQSCLEPMTEEVKDKTRANFCEFFEPRPDAFTGEEGPRGPVTALSELFGDSADAAAEDEGAERDPGDALDDLFRDPDESRD